jgi:hypothetical protein
VETVSKLLKSMGIIVIWGKILVHRRPPVILLVVLLSMCKGAAVGNGR